MEPETIFLVESGSYFLRVVFKNNFEFFTEMFDNLSCESGNIQAIQMLLITSWEANDDLLNTITVQLEPEPIKKAWLNNTARNYLK